MAGRRRDGPSPQSVERGYAPTEAIVPRALLEEASDAETDDFMRRKHVAFEGITALKGSYTMQKKDGRPAAIAWRDRAVEDGVLIQLTVDGWRGPRWALAEDAAALATVEAGRVPRGWGPLDTTTTEEATFLAPLDPVSARKRAKELFDFDYIWEVYTPAPKRKFGYYALPVLWGDRLVARFDGRFDRTASTFAILGFWPEDPWGCSKTRISSRRSPGVSSGCDRSSARSTSMRALCNSESSNGGFLRYEAETRLRNRRQPGMTTGGATMARAVEVRHDRPTTIVQPDHRHDRRRRGDCAHRNLPALAARRPARGHVEPGRFGERGAERVGEPGGQRLTQRGSVAIWLGGR